MALTTLAEVTGFISPGTTKVLALPAAAGYPALTLAEATTGVDVTNQVVNGSNWQLSVANPSAATLGSTFVAQARGMRSMTGTPTLVFRAAADGTDIRATFTIGQSKFMFFGWGGTGTGTFYDLYATQVANVTFTPDFPGGSLNLVTVEFAAVKTPSLFAAYPTS